MSTISSPLSLCPRMTSRDSPDRDVKNGDRQLSSKKKKSVVYASLIISTDNYCLFKWHVFTVHINGFPFIVQQMQLN
jgi:hypothetical protein